MVGLVHGEDLRAEPDPRRELGQERAREQVGAAVDVHEVGVVTAELLAEQLEERRVHQRLLVEQETEHLDRALRPLARFEELAHRVLVVLGGDLDPRVVTVLAEPRRERLELGVPQLRGSHRFVREHLEAEPPGIAGELAMRGLAARRRSSTASALSIVNGLVARP